ncbi:unnamed protein product, partial [marine sediment metagenome]
DQSVVETMRQAFDRRRKLIVGLLNDIEGISCYDPKGAFYVFPQIDDAVKAGGFASADEWATKLLEEKSVAVVPGEGFGSPGYARLSYATSDENIKEGLKRIAEFVAQA